MKKLKQYLVIKLNTNQIIENNYCLNISEEEAKKDNLLIALGNNQLIRFIKKHDRNQKTFIDSLVSIEDEKVKDYKKIAKNGFILNGKKYVRFGSGAGQLKDNTVFFIDESLKPDINKRLINGAKIDKINTNKFNAYYGLYLSAGHVVTTPKFCIVPDYYVKVTGNVDCVEEDYYINDKGKETKCLKLIPNQTKTLDINAFDGQGLISPEFAKTWADDLELQYLPSQFIIRGAFIKGSVVTFDFKKFAEIHNTFEIVDVYGNSVDDSEKKYDIRDFDIILTESQFKLWNCYDNLQNYQKNCKQNDHVWLVTKVNKSKDKSMSEVNYQYLQCLELTKDSILKLAEPTMNWIKKINNYDLQTCQELLLGDIAINDLPEYNLSKNIALALIARPELLNDSYIRSYITKLARGKINRAKIGRIEIDGNYQVMVSDPYAQIQHILGLNVTGLLQSNEYYSNYWLQNNIKKVLAMRSPMVSYSETNVLNLKNNPEIHEWYKYQQSGIVYNIFGLDIYKHQGSDWDGDIVFTTNNQIMIEAVKQNTLPIISQPKTAPKVKLTEKALIEADIRAFNNKVGRITNYSTIFISMLPQFKPGTPEHEELQARIKLLSIYIGSEIDSTKGIEAIPVPDYWHKYKKGDNFRNWLVANKKPYFMRYIYAAKNNSESNDMELLDNRLSKYLKDSNNNCKALYGMSVLELKKSEDITEEQKEFLKNYYYKNPVTNTLCPLNYLCWEVEKNSINIKFPKSTLKKEEFLEMAINKSINKDYRRFNKIKELLEELGKNTNKAVISFQNTTELYNTYSLYMQQICSNRNELANYLTELHYGKRHSKRRKTALWILAGAGLTENILVNSNNNSLHNLQKIS